MKKQPVEFRSDIQDFYFNYALREARLAKGYTLKNLGERANIKLVTLQAYERCYTFPSKEKALRICKVLNKPVRHIFPKQLRKTTLEISEERRKHHYLRLKHLDAFQSEEVEDKTEEDISERAIYEESEIQDGIYLDEPELPSSESAQNESSTLEKAIYFSLLGRVRKLLKTLPPTDAELIKMRFGIDNIPHTFNEIAQRYSTTPQNAQNYLKRALNQLRHPRRLVCLADFLLCQNS